MPGNIRTASKTEHKTPDETLVRAMSFANGMSTGETITSVDIQKTYLDGVEVASGNMPAGGAVDPVLVQATAIDSQAVEITFDGGVEGNVYEIKIMVSTSRSQDLEGWARVRIDEG